MSSEIFQIIFNSQGSNVLSPVATAANRASITYNVNWRALIPSKYNKFNCQVVFTSIRFAGLLVDNGFLSIDLGRTNVYDGLQQSQELCIVCPVYITAAISNYSSTNNDNNTFTMDYPNSNSVTLTLNNFNGTAIMANMPHYVVTLNITGYTV